jgi:hypothetical protein
MRVVVEVHREHTRGMHSVEAASELVCAQVHPGVGSELSDRRNFFLLASARQSALFAVGMAQKMRASAPRQAFYRVECEAHWDEECLRSRSTTCHADERLQSQALTGVDERAAEEILAHDGEYGDEYEH